MITFNQDIKPYFTPCYRTKMLFFCDLWKSKDCQTNWQDINNRVADGTMPKAGCPEGVWDSSRRQQFLGDFQAWKDQGFQEG